MKKDEFSVNIKHFFVYSALSFAVLFIVCFTILIIVEWKVRDTKIEELKNHEKSTVGVIRNLISDDLQDVTSDLIYLSTVFEKFYCEETDAQLKENWKVFSEKQEIYDQIRYIDADGIEQIRIEYDGENSFVVAQEDLQDKSDRYYFIETASLPEGSIYISPIDLNVENGEIETPNKPIMRFCVPLYYQEEFVGIIVINFLANEIFSKLGYIQEDSYGNIMILNCEGYWMENSDISLEWGFMFDDGEDLVFANSYPEVWQKIIAGEESVLVKEGLFTSYTVDIGEEIQKKNSVDSNDLCVGSGDIYIVSSILYGDYPEVHLTDGPFVFILELIAENYLMTIILAYIAFSFGLILYLYMRAYKKTQFFSKYDSLTKVYNRRAATDKLDEMLAVKDRRNFVVSICFVDVNGLKQVNDVLGHKCGDELLATAADIMKSAVREGDFVARMGGDEFLIVLSRADKDVAENVWKRIVTSFKKINEEEDRPYLISLSHGIVSCGGEDTCATTDLMISNADEIMYSEKKVIKEGLCVVREKGNK